ncbi:MAG: PspC domain-containing protein [Patescibacteria group bacterium]|nr:PspC domain-containing protein [Patescibacteria group bacterium]
MTEGQPASAKKLYRSKSDRIIAGVCGGLGEYLNIDPILFRIIFLVLLFAGGSGFWLYLLLAIIIPNEPGGYTANAEKNNSRIHDFADEMRENVQNFAHEVRGGSRRNFNQGRVLIGAAIVIIGAIMLLDQFFPIYRMFWKFFWPSLIIVLGIFILAKAGRRQG